MKEILVDGGNSHTIQDERPDGSIGPITIHIDTDRNGIASGTGAHATVRQGGQWCFA